MTQLKNPQVTFKYRDTIVNVKFLRFKKYLHHVCSDEGLEGTVVNRTFPSINGGSFKITLTVSLNQ